ncbi:MAG: hypothetical protein ABSA93_11785 [Streptosporangiaceae bacterium]|jgi:hypothetical protein
MGAIAGGVPIQVLADGAPPAASAYLDTLAAGAIVGTVIPSRLVATYWSEAAALAEHGFANGQL